MCIFLFVLSYKTQKHSRAYFGFKAPEDVYDFAAFFNGHVFVNEKGISLLICLPSTACMYSVYLFRNVINVV